VRLPVVFCLLATATLGCVSRFTGRDVEVMNEDVLRERAGFELGCPPGQLVLSVFHPQTVGVEGCGKKAVYVRTNDGVWVADPVAAPSR
jgi:hypothetical protein